MTSKTTPVLYTIGYEKATMEGFLKTLTDNEIGILVDIRSHPKAKRAEFSGPILRKSVECAGMEYLHIPELGMPKEGLYRARLGKLDKAWDIYEEQVLAKQAGQLQWIVDMATRKKVCLMCYEHGAFQCHRHLTAQATKLNVHHL